MDLRIAEVGDIHDRLVGQVNYSPVAIDDFGDGGQQTGQPILAEHSMGRMG